jgi:hypothetical protein
MKNLHKNKQSSRQFMRQTLLSAGGLLLTSVASAFDEIGSTDLDAGQADAALIQIDQDSGEPGRFDRQRC